MHQALCTLTLLHSTLFCPHCTTLHYTLYTVHYVLRTTIRSTHYAVRTMHYELCTMQFHCKRLDMNYLLCTLSCIFRKITLNYIFTTLDYFAHVSWTKFLLHPTLLKGRQGDTDVAPAQIHILLIQCIPCELYFTPSSMYSSSLKYLLQHHSEVYCLDCNLHCSEVYSLVEVPFTASQWSVFPWGVFFTASHSIVVEIPRAVHLTDAPLVSNARKPVAPPQWDALFEASSLLESFSWISSPGILPPGILQISSPVVPVRPTFPGILQESPPLAILRSDRISSTYPS